MNNNRDEYLENLYLERDIHLLTINNSAKFRPEVVKKAKEMLKECEKLIERHKIFQRGENNGQ